MVCLETDHRIEGRQIEVGDVLALDSVVLPDGRSIDSIGKVLVGKVGHEKAAIGSRLKGVVDFVIDVLRIRADVEAITVGREHHRQVSYANICSEAGKDGVKSIGDGYGIIGGHVLSKEVGICIVAVFELNDSASGFVGVADCFCDHLCCLESVCEALQIARR